MLNVERVCSPLLPRDASSARSKYELLHFSGCRLRKLLDESDPLRRLKVRKAVPHVEFEVFLGRFRPLSQDDKGMGRFTPSLMWHADDGYFLYRWVAQQAPFHFDRGDVLSAADNYILKTVPDFDETIRVDHRSIAGVEPTVPDGCVRRLGIVVIPFITTLPRTTISPRDCPSCGTSSPSSSTHPELSGAH